MTTHDPVKSPSHYRGASGLQSIEITHAYRLGPDLTQAVDYILRAGRKTPDPRQDLAKAAFYLRYAATCRDRVFGAPLPLPGGYAVHEIARDFGLTRRREWVLGLILKPNPSEFDLYQCADMIDLEIEVWSLEQIDVAIEAKVRASGRSA